MARPGRLMDLINDTYPDSNGNRILMRYEVEGDRRTDIGVFRMISDKPNAACFDVKVAQARLDCRVLRKFPRDLYLFTRSGFHCDLHPRWSHDGRTAYFDSIHEGLRQIYAVGGV
jgi:hypothetical protein